MEGEREALTEFFPVLFGLVAALAGVASFVASLACLVILVTGWRPGAAVDAPAAAAQAARGDRTSPPTAVDEEQAEADVLDLTAQIEARQAVLRKRRQAINDQVNEGWPLEVAEGRAAMKLADLDPDDAEAVVAFNNRHGVM